MSEENRCNKKWPIYTAVQHDTCHSPFPSLWKPPRSRGAAVLPHPKGSSPATACKVEQSKLSWHIPTSSPGTFPLRSTHLNGPITAELVHAQEGQADTLCDTSSSHCCCSLQGTEQTTIKICMHLPYEERGFFCITYFCPLHCHHPFRKPSSHMSILLKIQYREKQHCSSSKIWSA